MCSFEKSPPLIFISEVYRIYYTKDENALELALAVEKLYDKDDLTAINRIKKKINDLENITSRLNKLILSVTMDANGKVEEEIL